MRAYARAVLVNARDLVRLPKNRLLVGGGARLLLLIRQGALCGKTTHFPAGRTVGDGGGDPAHVPPRAGTASTLARTAPNARKTYN